MQASNPLEIALRHERQIVVGILVVVISACWVYLLAGAGMDAYMPALSGSITHAVVLFWMWWFMMIAMMLPSAAPMVLLHAAVTRRGLAGGDGAGSAVGSSQVVIASAAFMAGYLAVWGAFSVAAVILQLVLEDRQLLSPMMASTSTYLGSGLLLAAGIWQLTSVKTVCLRHCRTPASFLSAHWRPGVGGGFTMGVRHGGYCLGCCWFLMALLFYGGVMSLVWIIGLALLVLLEKILHVGIAFARVTGGLLIVWGIWLAFPAF